MEFCGFLLLLVVILINFLIVNYVKKLENISCECSESWKREYIKIYSLVTIILVSVITIIPLLLQIMNINYKHFLVNNIFITLISYIYAIFGFVNIYALFTYSQKIVLIHCSCSDGWEKVFIYYYSMLIMSLYIFLAALFLIATICYGKITINLNDIKKIKKSLSK